MIGLDDKRREQLTHYLAGHAITLRDLSLFHLALCHRSWTNELGHPELNYERLELLGDGVMNLLVLEKLYHMFPNAAEGVLSRMKSQVVSRESFLWIAKELKLDSLILIGSGEKRASQKSQDSILADCLEAIMAAIHLDGGLEQARKFMDPWLEPAIGRREELRDWKSLINQYCQQTHGETPLYETIEEKGPPHDRTFTVQVLINGKPAGRGRGTSKQQAQQEAAHQAVDMLKIGEDS